MTALRSVLFVLLASGAAAAQAPSAAEVQRSLNSGVELNHLDSQELRDLAILAGGRTAAGDYLYVGEGVLVWKIGIEELKEKYRAGLPGDVRGRSLGDIAAGFVELQTGAFERGAVVTKVRVRVRLERAGNDWIVTSAKVKEFGVNPLSARSGD